MKGCLAVIGGAAVLLFLVVMCSAVNMASHVGTSTASQERMGVSGGTDTSCATADKRENQAADALNNNQYQKAYDTSISGLHYVSLCGNDDDNLVNKAYLMSFKALAEHHLSSGDSRTDLNEANALLVECQTHPGFYGTHVGAQCETQENTNIHAQTNWEMEQYQQ
jgi:hypothetical protein